ncbi:pathogenesis-related protein PR-1 type-like [Wolffia australiana]
MAPRRLPLALVACVLAFAAACSVQAQNTPQDYLAAHNAARAAVGVGPMVWDAQVTAYAQNYANQRRVDCRLIHSTSNYGENLFWGSGKEWTAREAVQSWVNERKDYNYATNTCTPGRVCGHYTQVVWRNSVRLGCARVKCNSGAILITCNYSPRGNYIGQRPF